MCNCIHELLNVFEDPAQRDIVMLIWDLDGCPLIGVLFWCIYLYKSIVM